MVRILKSTPMVGPILSNIEKVHLIVDVIWESEK